MKIEDSLLLYFKTILVTYIMMFEKNRTMKLLWFNFIKFYIMSVLVTYSNTFCRTIPAESGFSLNAAGDLSFSLFYCSYLMRLLLQYI